MSKNEIKNQYQFRLLQSSEWAECDADYNINEVVDAKFA